MKCDDKSLELLLDADDDSSVHRQVAQHVESCDRCQTRLVQLAADVDDWSEAKHWLAKDNAADDFSIDAEARPRYRAHVTKAAAWTESMAQHLLSPPSHPEMLGRIGRYDVERLIGSGWMGVVFKAWDTELNRPVAVKLLAPYLAANGSARKRFAREARAAAAVVDEHVVAIHNVESGDDPEKPPFLVMKYIAGGSLQQRLDRDGPLEICEILRIGMQTARGLAAAHAQGLIHRDVKPSNILLDEGVERALLTDFGLARAEDDACLTRSGFHPGTPHYMSPEQVRGEAIDGRSDLFSLGCVLYALCTGHPPFRAETSYAVLRRITDDTARPIRELNNNIPEWLEQIVMKLLSKSREDRFESAKQVGGLLEDCLAHVQQPTTISLPDFKDIETSGRGNPIYYVIKGIFLMISRRPSAAVAVAAMMICIAVMLFPDFHQYDISGTVWETIGETDLPSSFKGWDGSVVMGDPTGRTLLTSEFAMPRSRFTKCRQFQRSMQDISLRKSTSLRPMARGDFHSIYPSSCVDSFRSV